MGVKHGLAGALDENKVVPEAGRGTGVMSVDIGRPVEKMRHLVKQKTQLKYKILMLKRNSF